MAGYLTGFVVYLMAMLGVIFIGMIVVKKSLNFNSRETKPDFLKIESRLAIEPRKNLYVVKAGDERFLISTGTEGCRFMTKIKSGSSISGLEIPDSYPQIKLPAMSIED